TAAIRAGDMSASPAPIYDPSTGNADGSGRLVMPGNQLAAFRRSSIADKLVALTPLPNIAGALTNNCSGRIPLRPLYSGRESQRQRFATTTLRYWKSTRDATAAFDHLTKALQIDPTLMPPHYNLGVLYIRTKRSRGSALAEFQMVSGGSK